jgi:hypothetical protein
MQQYLTHLEKIATVTAQKIHYNVLLPQYLEEKLLLKAILPKVESEGQGEIMQLGFNPIDLQQRL